MTQSPLLLDRQPLSLADVNSVARAGRGVTLGDTSRTALEAARQVIDAGAAGKTPLYGVNTGFGSLSRHRIEPDEVRAVQRNLIRSHAAGVGPDLPEPIVRAMLVILAASLSRGHSGVRPIVVERLIDLLNHKITPRIPARGSVGASGDLAPLSHAALVLIGEGEARVDDRVLPAADALGRAGLEPIRLEAKEGLALINGTHLMAAIGTLAMIDLEHLVDAALAATAMAIDACRGTDQTLDERVHRARCQPGQIEVARILRDQLAGSAILTAHRDDDPRVQDPYSLRAVPQVVGAVLDTIAHVRGVVIRELGAVTDNPLVFADTDAVLSGANFHGMPLAIALDTLTIALAHLAGIAERRIDWLLRASDSENPVNIYLSPDPGLHSGLMIAQYTAAACCNELQTLTTVSSVANIPTSAGMEDYNSFGVTSAHQAWTAMARARSVVAIELLVMAEALEYQRPLHSSDAVERTYAAVRSRVPRLTEDRPPAPDIAALEELIVDGAFALGAAGVVPWLERSRA